ncbi:MAG: tetratricopeptide repeat protein, partial [Cyanobacteriota bacterium]|nr:tetratricopeptide repeat protein [Cyanobacteriota bacterium]
MARKWSAFLLTVERFLKQLFFRKINDYKTAKTQRKKVKKVGVVLFLIGFLFAFEISPVFSQTPQPVAQLVRQGKDFYDVGQYRQAVEKLKQAVDSFAKSGNTLNQSVTLSNLSLAYQELGEWSKAEKTINQSLQIIGFDSQKLQINELSNQQLKILAPSLDIYGKLWFNRSQPENALKYWQLAGNIYQKLNQQSNNNS